MEAVVLVIHLILALGIIALVLLQRSEGGGLGIGGSGGAGGLATPQAAANVLTRMTAIFAALFFGTSLVLGILAGTSTSQNSILDSLDQPVAAVETQIDNSEENIQEEIPDIPVP